MRYKNNFNNAPILHDIQLALNFQNKIEFNNQLKNAYKCPRDLSIYLSHNYEKKTLFERNLDYLGIKNYTCLILPLKPWSHVLRLRYFVEWLKKCQTEFVLHCDADDVVLTTDPQMIIDVFMKHKTRVLYCSTDFPHGYKCMPDVFAFAENKHPKRYLNAGVFIGYKSFVLELYEDVLKYVVDNPSSAKQFFENEIVFKNNFPLGIGCDQTILRFLEPKYYPDIKVDVNNYFAFRNNNKKFYEKVYLNLAKKFYKGF
jgi:hypothetical protein